ncbi:MAG: flagellar motor protein [Sphingomonadaceae bacterium]
MNITTVVGMLLGFGALIVGVIMEDGDLVSFLKPSAAVIVLGGTFGAAMVSFPGTTLARLPRMISKAFVSKTADAVGVADILVRLSERARREGLLALEEEVPKLENHLLRKGVMLVVDGTDPDLVRSVLLSDISVRDREVESDASLLEAMGGYAPTMGIIGTVMGLVNVLGNIEDPSHLGEAIAVAFIATFYGISTANLVWLPLGSKLKKQAEKTQLLDEMILEGLASIQSGENPRILQERLEPYLPREGRGKQTEEPEGDAAAGRIREDYQTT